MKKLRKGWRWLGEQNAEKLLAKAGVQPKNWFLKFTARMVSLRTAASLGLLGGGMAIGFGSAVGIGMLAARRVMGGTGVAFGSYDLMRMATEKRALSFNEDGLEKMSPAELEEKMAEFEARAKFSGEKIVHNRDYNLLRREYKNRIGEIPEEEEDRIHILPKLVQELDKELREKQAQVSKEEKHRKVAAVGVGLFSIGAFSASSIAKLIEGRPEFEGITPEQIQDTVREGQIVTPEQLQEAADSEVVLLPPTEEIVREPGVTEPGVIEEPEVEVEAAARAREAAAAAEAAVERLDQTDEYVSTVRGGGSVWNAIRRLVENEVITEEQFKEALTNPESRATLPSGNEIHISELHLVHEGDQVIYVPGEGETPGRFEVRDYADDEFNFGNAEDLAEAMKREGHWGHKSHEWLYDKLDEYPEGYTPSAEAEVTEAVPQAGAEEVVETVPEGVVPPQEALEQAAQGALEVAEQEMKFEWGMTRFVLDEHGRIADVLIEDSLSPEKRADLMNRAVEEFLRPDFRRTLERGIPEGTQHLIMPGLITQAEEGAWEAFRLRRVLERITDTDSKEAYFLRYKINLGIKTKELILGARIFKNL